MNESNHRRIGRYFSKFSFTAHESNSSGVKLYPLIVTFYDAPISKNVLILLALSNLTGDCWFENIFLLLDSKLKKVGIPWNSFIAFCSDNASVVISLSKGVVSFIKQKISNMILSSCACCLIYLVS